MEEMSVKALELGVPLSAQIDLTYRCNERCVHCYLDHDDHGEMTTGELKTLLDQLASAGVLFLTLSGGEILLRKDFFEVLQYARELSFCVKLKTNAILIREAEAAPQADAVNHVSQRVDVQIGIVHAAYNPLPRGKLRHRV